MAVLLTCLGFAFIHLVLDGTLLRLWSLHRDQTRIQSQIDELRSQSEVLQSQIDRALDPRFIEQQARDRFDLVNEGELIFVFSGD